MTASISEQELFQRLKLWRTPGIGPMSLRRLLQQLGSADAVFNVSGQLLQTTGLKPVVIEALQSPSAETLAGAELDLKWSTTSAQRHILTPEHEHYPALLADIDASPPLLFAVGTTALLNDPQLALIGSRNPSREGRDNARAFAAYLAEHGLTITSGLAEGIDAISHQAALDSGGTTIAVVATGLDMVYPSQNRKLAEQISQAGLIISEYPIGTKPLPQHFPRRNRIISGLSVGTLVVEAALKSGSLVTAKHAMEQGREVFAIPGSIHNPMARGCHQLIRQGAKLVETAQDILEEIAPQLAPYLQDGNTPQAQTSSSRPHAPKPNKQAIFEVNWDMDEEHKRILSALGSEPLPIDQIILNTGLTADVVSSILLMLELQGFVVACGGGHYMRQTPRE
ncbi:DNA-processing protein DprA [Thiofilum flexile]|uniref:DNA-processing protein DprA n=1 Tax=Thiofilum flexile TaxID=125627 RepID=UPI00037AC391|nr:DNA-processing protein DprA [Thiofilum flexile]